MDVSATATLVNNSLNILRSISICVVGCEAEAAPAVPRRGRGAADRRPAGECIYRCCCCFIGCEAEAAPAVPRRGRGAADRRPAGGG